MSSIEELVALFGGIPAARRERWPVETIARDRLHLGRGENGEFTVFLEGGRGSFGALPAWAGIEHSDEVTALPAGRVISAVRISSRDPVNGNRVIAHIAYEFARRLAENPAIDNRELLEGVSWMLSLLGDRESILSTERQYGLVGECILLRRLLAVASRLAIPAAEVLRRWRGAGTSRRDFASRGIAIEVKTTSHATRMHHFGTIEQLDSQLPGEEVFLFSVGIRQDSSAPMKLPHYISDVQSGLVVSSGKVDDTAVARFHACLLTYGYDPDHTPVYLGLPGFRPPHLQPVLFRESGLDRVRLSSFKGDRLPSMVVSVGYTLDVQGPGLTGGEAEVVLERILTSPALD